MTGDLRHAFDVEKTSTSFLPDVSTRIVELRGLRQVRRNADRFPPDFLLELTNQDLAALRSQIATLKSSRGGHRKYPPIAFTEHGAIMAATVLNSPRAVQMTTYVVRAFVHFRRTVAAHSTLAIELDALKRKVTVLDADTRRQFDQVFEAILGLMVTTPRKT